MWNVSFKNSLLLMVGSLCLFTRVYGGDFAIDPQQVKGPSECAECHEKTFEAWKQSHHASTFSSMPRSQDARKIADKMGIKRIKSESDCLTCHFTMTIETEKPKPIAGISCESCHGAGAQWIDVHSDFGGKDIKAENEDPAHKKMRYQKSEAAGMIRPGNLYQLAKNCYSCHTVPNEKLVNVGGHVAGSKFELVRWTQGEVRHNLWYSDDNIEASLEKRRMFYILGKMVDYEYALRGVAKATKKADYAIAMAKRSKRALAFLKKIAQSVDNQELKNILAISQKAKIKLNNSTALLAAAESVSKQAALFASKYNGSEFPGIDSVLPTPEKYKGEVFNSR